MRHMICGAVLAASFAGPVWADDKDQGLDLMEEGVQLLLRGLISDMEPAIDDLRGMMDSFGPAMQLFAEEMGPALSELLKQVDDIRNYDAPEILPNGDIIIRRREEAPEYTPSDPVEL